MKRITITYHMERPGEVAESCITLPMTDDIADDILWMEEDSTYLGAGHNGEVRRLLESLATIQGYKFTGACCPKEALE